MPNPETPSVETLAAMVEAVAAQLESEATTLMAIAAGLKSRKSDEETARQTVRRIKELLAWPGEEP